MAGYSEGFKNLVGTICGAALGAGVVGKDMTKKLGKKGTEILYYLCAGGFLGLGLLTRRGGNPPPSQVVPPPPPPGHEAPRPKPPGTKNVRPERPGNRHMRRPGANRPARPGQQPPPPGFICFVNSRGREVEAQILSPGVDNGDIDLREFDIDSFVHKL